MDSNYTRWKCDRCQAEQIHEYGSQPRQWIAIQSTRPPRAEFQSARLCLCRTCADAFGDFVSATPLVGEVPETVGRVEATA